jgi:cardiolipin synthase
MWTFVKENVWPILFTLNYLLVAVMVVFILLRNSNPVKTLTYLFALVTLPFLGLLVYYLVGRDYRKNKIFEKKRFLDNAKLREWKAKFELNKEEREDFEEQFGEGIFKIYKLLQNNEKAVLTFDNDAKILINGEQKFKMLREDLRNAKHHIHMEYFIIVDDELGQEIIEILFEKAQEGVQIRLIYDDVGSDLSAKTKRRLTASSIEHFPFMPVIFTNSTSKLNYRDHRKIVVIDGKIGYVGGINIDKRYDNTYHNERYWRDTHLRLEGSSVGSLQASFLLSWEFVSNKKIRIQSAMFPKRKPISKDPVAVQIAASGPDTDWANIMEALFAAINGARDYIYITSPYLVPNDEIITALSTASRSGVAVSILIPYKSDSMGAQYASDSYIEQLLYSNIKVFRYKKGFMHAKSIVIDDVFTSIGTANLDYRSFSINFEINAMMYGVKIAKEMKKVFVEDLKECEEVYLERWVERTVTRKLKESVCRLWGPLL